MLLLGWAFLSGVMYMVFFINLEPIPKMNQTPNVEGILPLVGLALLVSILGILLTMILSENNY